MDVNGAFNAAYYTQMAQPCLNLLIVGNDINPIRDKSHQDGNGATDDAVGTDGRLRATVVSS